MFFRKKAVLLIHGFVGGVYDFGNLQNELEVYRKFDVFTFTLPGHEKMIVKDVKYGEWISAAEEQMEFLIQHGYKKIYVVGHSMGGVIAVHLANKYKQVKKLALAAPAFRYFAFDEGKISLKGLGETIKSVPELLKGEGQDKVFERIRKTPIATLFEFTSLVSKYQDDLEGITCPVLTIHGLNDKVVPGAGTKLVYDRVKSKVNVLVNISGISHDCFVKDKGSEVKKIIIDFLRKNNYHKKEKIEI